MPKPHRKSAKSTARSKPARPAVASFAVAASARTPLLDDIRDILRNARGQAYAAVNTIMVRAYWNIGRRIVQEEQNGKNRADYGAFLIRNLSRQLGDEFGRGVSIANLKNFRQFYLAFSDFEKSYALRSQLTWTHWRQLMRVENPDARDYYIAETAGQNWSSRQLERAIATRTWERLLSPPKNAAAPVADLLASPHSLHAPHSPRTFIKDPYVLEFLDLPETGPRDERHLEDTIILRLRDFIMELGKGFSFIGRQYRVSTETSHFYIDLVFYNYLLKCFVLFDLKPQKLTHTDIGQMDMYVRIFDDLKRASDDNPTLGIILCSDKDETMVRYSVLKENRQLFASKYRLILPSEEELRAELDRRHILQLPENSEK